MTPDAPLPAGRRRILLVRHGHADYFTPDGVPLDPREAPLSARGAVDVDALAAVLADVRIDLVLASPLRRARETAQRLVASRGLGVVIEPDLAEIRAGRLREIPPDDRERVLAHAYDDCAREDGRFVGGERFAAFRTRVQGALDALIARDGWSTALVVSHDAVNRVVLAWVLDAPHALPALEQDPACLDVVDIDGGLAGQPVRRKLLRAHNVTVRDPAKRDVRYTVMEQVYRAWRPAQDPASRARP